MGHWPTADVPGLLEAAQNIQLEDRPSYLSDPIVTGPGRSSNAVEEFERWLTVAIQNGSGLFHFYQ
jgi:hypothetical protein